MTTITVTELKQNLSFYLSELKGGKGVLVMHRGRPIAALEPLTPDDDQHHLALLVKDGIALPPKAQLPHDFLSSVSGDEQALEKCDG